MAQGNVVDTQMQTNLTLSFVINSAQTIKNPTSESAREVISWCLDNSTMTKDKFSIVWGPALYFHSSASVYADNIVMVVQNKEVKTDYRVVIAGTNADSIYDVKTEDKDVFSTVPLNQCTNLNCPSSIWIASGTADGLDAILNTLKWNNGKNTTTLFQFLCRLPHNSSISITGHSLGGTLASTLALVYAQDLSSFIGNPVICDAFAGATAGNSAFADYISSAGNLKLRRIWNNLDVVPHMWDVNDIAKLPTLYPPNILVSPSLIAEFDGLIVALKTFKLDYKQPAPEVSLSGKVVNGPQYNGFRGQAIYQHLTEYIYLVNLQPRDITTHATTGLVK
jgi:triacylglycerol lipase